ncbi:hypothetical protein SETIT_7G149300v2 [Setaria italica]|uniref:Uncharacterized protein n=2 Tax=Setaria TaxID=4554 RepID=A0A368RVZ6_SETIT|nr:hypothetical protein SETIT_7G149300v2 [Setaria italica]TKW05172.1 hypothetical protein SEVIR_7G157400v2 [Setaria viridis]
MRHTCRTAKMRKSLRARRRHDKQPNDGSSLLLPMERRDDLEESGRDLVENDHDLVGEGDDLEAAGENDLGTTRAPLDRTWIQQGADPVTSSPKHPLPSEREEVQGVVGEERERGKKE